MERSRNWLELELIPVSRSRNWLERVPAFNPRKPLKTLGVPEIPEVPGKNIAL